MTPGQFFRDPMTESQHATPIRTIPVSAMRLILLCVLFAASGANCQQMVRSYQQPLPRVLAPGATLAQVIEAVNQNTAGVQSFSTMQATLNAPGYPALRANLAFQRPRNFRLRGDLALTGATEVDLGSNDEIFWFWVRREQPPALYFCRHDQFATSSARQIMPVEPDWLAQALGLISFDASESHDGPYPLRGDRLEIRSTAPGASGARRVTVIDAARALVLEQHVYDVRGVRVASAIMSGHERDPATGVVLPSRVRVLWPLSNFEMTIDMHKLQINRLVADPAALFTKPEYTGHPNVDLASPGALQNLPATPAPASPLPAPPGTAVR